MNVYWIIVLISYWIAQVSIHYNHVELLFQVIIELVFQFGESYWITIVLISR
jgi:hypothetical protein